MNVWKWWSAVQSTQTTHLHPCVSGWSSHPGTFLRRCSFHQCHHHEWNHLPDTWIWEWCDGIYFPWIQIPFHQCTANGNSLQKSNPVTQSFHISKQWSLTPNHYRIMSAKAFYFACYLQHSIISHNVPLFEKFIHNFITMQKGKNYQSQIILIQ